MSFDIIRPWSRIEDDGEPPVLNIPVKSFSVLIGSTFEAPEYTCIGSDGENLWHRVKFDTRNLDLYSTGENKVPVSVSDRYGNTTTDEITIFVGAIYQLNIRNNPPDGYYDVTLFSELDAVEPVFHDRLYITDGYVNISLSLFPDLQLFGCAFYEGGTFGFVPIGITR